MNHPVNSEIAFREALALMPGGVNSPVRSFRGISGHPLFISRARGSKIHDIDANEYIDYCLSWGVCIHGHAHPEILNAARAAIEQGSSFGAPTLSETRLASLVISMVPSIEKLRLVSSGTEAVMSAVRLARAFTERTLIVKFDGCYHGHSDGMLISAGSGLSGIFSSNSRGITENTMRDTLSIPFNDTDSLLQTFEKHGRNIAAVIVEPVPANMGLVLPEYSFLATLSRITKRYGALLIFDEVITGFRIAMGGAQEHYQIIPDLTILGKIIGGGFPMAAYGGSAEIMDLIAPAGDVYQAGTLSGNPVAVAAGIATLEMLKQPGYYEEYFAKTSSFEKEMARVREKYPVSVNSLNGMFSLFFSKTNPKNFQDVKETDVSRFPDFYKKLLTGGVYLSPGYFETSFVSTAHSENDFQKTLDAIYSSLKTIY
jgi:glutamate-1-semialdehyde 2,1-aminomutase